MDNIGSFGFGYSLNLLRDDTNAFMLPGMSGSNYRNNVYIQAPMVKWLGVEPFFLGLWRVRVKYLFLLRRLVKARLSEGKDAKEDLFSYVVDAKDPESGTGINVDELWTEATFFIGAGMYERQSGSDEVVGVADLLFMKAATPQLQPSQRSFFTCPATRKPTPSSPQRFANPSAPGPTSSRVHSYPAAYTSAPS
jgi:hypothetical protein